MPSDTLNLQNIKARELGRKVLPDHRESSQRVFRTASREQIDKSIGAKTNTSSKSPQRPVRNNLHIFLGGIFLLICFLTLAFLPAYLSDDLDTRNLLQDLVNIPVFPGDVLSDKGWNVSRYDEGPGGAQGMAFIVIKSQSPAAEVLLSYSANFPALQNQDNADLSIAPICELPEPIGRTIPREIRALADSTPLADRPYAYVIWGIRPLHDYGWDFRAWRN